MKGWKQTGSSIRFLIDSEGLGDTPNKQNCILCVQMHCLPSCEYRNESNYSAPRLGYINFWSKQRKYNFCFIIALLRKVDNFSM